MAGELESPELRHEDSASFIEDSFLSIKVTRNPPPIDPLGKLKTNSNKISIQMSDISFCCLLGVELGVNVLDCRKPYLPFSEFYNELLSDAVEMDRDFANYKSELGILRYIFF